MAAEEFKKLSKELKEAREKAAISLKEIASKTRIDIKFLQAIEEGKFDVMPEVYIRAFLKEYASHSNLNPAEVLRKYELAKENKPIDEMDEEPLAEKVDEEKKPKEKKEFTDDSAQQKVVSQTGSSKNRLILLISLFIFIVLLIAAYFLFFRESTPDIIVERPFEEVLEEKQTQQKNRFEVTEDELIPVPATVEGDSLTLSILATDTCWVSVTVDGNFEREFMLFNNTSTTIRAANRFDLIVGNLGGVDFRLNGESLPIEGGEGQRETFSIDETGVIDQNE